MHSSSPLPIAADVSTCETEAIHIPGAIQPHGVLFAVDEATGRLTNVSANAGRFFGRDAASLLNLTADSVFGEGTLDRWRRGAAELGSSQAHFQGVPESPEYREYEASVHRADGMLVAEFERAEPGDGSAEFYAAHAAVVRVQNASTVRDLSETVVHDVARVTGFDRVMMYRFDGEWNGEVIAEQCADGLEPYLGLHYPASDIPAQARELYRRNLMRVIPDAAYEAVPLVPGLHPSTNRPLDLSLSVLRSVSSLHLEYLRNMGVRATLTISLLKHGTLWGLIAAHHRGVKHVPFAARAACDLIGRTASLQISTIEDRLESGARMKLRALQPALLDAVNREGEFTDAIAVEALLQIAEAGGAAVKTEGEPRTVGSTPRGRDLRRIFAWLEDRDIRDGDRPFVTDSLPLENPDFAHLRDVACGLLAVPLTTTAGGWICWFRPELVRTVNWGGNPHKPVSGDGARISPRKSFEAWKEVVQLHSAAWTGPQIDAAIELRRLLSDVMMRRAREYAKLNAELARSNRELESFAHIASHDLKEPLRGIHHYAQFLQADYGDALDDKGRTMLRSVGALASRMEAQIQSLLFLAEVGHGEPDASCDAGAVLDEVLDLLAPRLTGFAVKREPLPRLAIAAPRLREVFLNLFTNAIKYSDKAEKSIRVGTTSLERTRPLPQTSDMPEARQATIFVEDNGIGIAEKHFDSIFRMFKRLHARDAYGGGNGAGLAIARKIVEQNGGSMWVESVPGEGSTFYFTVPQAKD